MNIRRSVSALGALAAVAMLAISAASAQADPGPEYSKIARVGGVWDTSSDRCVNGSEYLTKAEAEALGREMAYVAWTSADLPNTPGRQGCLLGGTE
ncbi:hypothetical protein ACIQ9Q_30965 [Streptomyces sp. NPDC094438]|uniref:hypothetical protein n=1 Tax=Streptomyces sp. NPDC094438 TaxID=3366061 RepID=UPI00381C63DD